jgi:hypothetical protein
MRTAACGGAPPLMSTSMFVTFAAVRHDGDRALEFVVAGHLPILRAKAGASSAEEITLTAAASGFGGQIDDQTLLLIRRVQA